MPVRGGATKISSKMIARELSSIHSQRTHHGASQKIFLANSSPPRQHRLGRLGAFLRLAGPEWLVIIGSEYGALAWARQPWNASLVTF